MTNKVDISTIYSALVQEGIHTESITWNRFSNYLLFSSVLIVAWATLWASGSDVGRNGKVLVGLCLLGIVSGGYWAMLGYRGRRMLDEIEKLGRDLERNTDFWPEAFVKYRQTEMLLKMRDELPGKWFATLAIHTGAPIVISVLYLVMLGVTLDGCFRG
jgi:hypothetical protein